MRLGKDTPDDLEPQNVQQLKEMRYYLFDASWFEANGRRLDQIRQLARELKDCRSATGSPDPYYYGNAVQFVLGNLMTLASLWDVPKLLAWRGVLSYCLDWPLARLDDLRSVQGDYGYEEFRTLLPAAVEAWPRLKHATSGERDMAEGL